MSAEEREREEARQKHDANKTHTTDLPDLVERMRQRAVKRLKEEEEQFGFGTTQDVTEVRKELIKNAITANMEGQTLAGHGNKGIVVQNRLSDRIPNLGSYNFDTDEISINPNIVLTSKDLELQKADDWFKRVVHESQHRNQTRRHPESDIGTLIQKIGDEFDIDREITPNDWYIDPREWDAVAASVGYNAYRAGVNIKNNRTASELMEQDPNGKKMIHSIYELEHYGYNRKQISNILHNLYKKIIKANDTGEFSFARGGFVLEEPEPREKHVIYCQGA
jgi:hypothetical protein